jgi:segregation and condensation protein B
MADTEKDKSELSETGEILEASEDLKKSKKKKTPKIKWNASTEKLDFKDEGVSEDVSELASFAARAAADFGIFSDDEPASPREEPVLGLEGLVEVASELAPVDLVPTLAVALAEQAEEMSAESTGDLLVEEMVLAARQSETEAESEADAVAASADEALAMSDEERALMEAELGPEQVEFVDTDRMVSIIESMLFSTDKPVSVTSLKVIFKGTNIRTKDITRALGELASEYADSKRGVTIEEINGGYQLRTKSDNSEYLRRLAKVRPFRLSGPALEVMAIVAYKQPITKHEIDEIRGVESGHLLRALMERGLVAFGERSELPGKPMTYNSTRKFLETFGLRNIRELPSLGEIDALLPEGIGEVEEEKETLSDLTDQMSTTLTSSYSDGEDELLKINEQLQAVDTTSEFFEQEKVRERDRRDRDRARDIRERLVVGEAVEEKDRRWLDRYEAKLHQTEAVAHAAAAAGVPLASAQGAEPVPVISDKLEALTEESPVKSAVKSPEAAATGRAADHEDQEDHEDEFDDAELDDLAAHADWDDEKQS